MHSKLEERYADADDVVLFHLQTVWEAEGVNTPERGPAVARSHGIDVPVAYDAHVDGARFSTFMYAYGTGGTPWSVVIDKDGRVRFSSFTPANPQRLATLIDGLRDAPSRKATKSPPRD